MSWEAVTWASKQAMKLPQEQLVLLVLANCADPDGVAFSEWRGSEHWWKYLVRRTRLSKSSLFRHINTLLDLGLCTRNELVLADGTRRPTIRLDLSSTFNFDEIRLSHSHQRDHSHGETETEESLESADIARDINDVDAANRDAEFHSHGETSPTGGNDDVPLIPTSGNDPFPIVGMHIDSSISCSKDSPLPPLRGVPPIDELWEEFLAAWRDPIAKMAIARNAWNSIPTAKRPEAVAATKGYSAHIAEQQARFPKSPPPRSARNRSSATMLAGRSGCATCLGPTARQRRDRCFTAIAMKRKPSRCFTNSPAGPKRFGKSTGVPTARSAFPNR